MIRKECGLMFDNFVSDLIMLDVGEELILSVDSVLILKVVFLMRLFYCGCDVLFEVIGEVFGVLLLIVLFVVGIVFKCVVFWMGLDEWILFVLEEDYDVVFVVIEEKFSE